jgi:hypothetical protein
MESPSWRQAQKPPKAALTGADLSGNLVADASVSDGRGILCVDLFVV